jgi:hypothetical protein
MIIIPAKAGISLRLLARLNQEGPRIRGDDDF